MHSGSLLYSATASKPDGENAGIEFLAIYEFISQREFKKELRWNYMYRR